MTAKIETPEDIYHIEPSWRHLDTNDTQEMIAYRESDVMFSWEQPDENDFVPPKVSYSFHGVQLTKKNIISRTSIFLPSAF